jgi:drug/metabolite transporter (DMT)-like permease
MQLRATLTFCALCLIWGIPYFLIKIALVDFSPAVVAWGRITLGALVLFPLAWRRGGLGAWRRHKAALTGFAVAELVVPFSMIAMGERWISSSLAGILVATVPMTVVLLAPAFGIKETMNAKRIAGLLIGFVGVIALLGIDRISSPLQWAGAACIAIAVVGYAAGPLIVQRYLADVDESAAVGVSLVIASIILLPFAALTLPAHSPTTHGMASLATLGIVCTAVAMLLYFYLINAAGAARASVIAYVNPAVAAILGVLLLDEHLGVGSITGLILILAGSWLATRRETAQVSSG